VDHVADTATTLDSDRIERLAYLCHQANAVYREYASTDPNWLGVAQSEAGLERSGFVSPRPGIVASTFHLAQLNTGHVVGLGLSLARLITDDAPSPGMPAAADAVSRAGIETAARAWWLLEHAIGPLERVARYLADMVYSSYEAEEYVGALGHPKADVGKLGLFPSVDQHTQLCDELGLSVSGARSRSPIVGGKKRPPSTTLVGQLMGDTPFRGQPKAVYSLTSGSQHGTTFAILRNFKATGATIGTHLEVVPVITQESIDFSVASLMSAYVAVMQRAVALFGWGHAAIDMFDISLHKTFR
jgi:hypothetical protein